MVKGPGQGWRGGGGNTCIYLLGNQNVIWIKYIFFLSSMGNSEYIVLQVLYVMKIKYSDGNKLLA
jgi:hypothetical protein